MSEIRLDRMHNQYVIIAPERLHRPSTPSKNEEDLEQKCPFCEGNESLTPSEIYALRNNDANTPGWRVRVVANIYKAMQIELDHKSRREGIFESLPGVGAHEIVIETPCHDCDMKDLEPADIENWLRALIIRMDDLKKDMRLVYLSMFKNVGFNAGAALEHPHTQLLALPVMPQDETLFLERNMRYYRRHGRGILEDIVTNELREKVRVIEEIGSFIAFCPYASGFPFEVMIAPKRNISSLNKCSRSEVTDLSLLISKVFQSLDEQLGSFDYNLSIKIPPLNGNFENEEYIPYLEKNYRFHIRIIPRIYRLGGFEIATSTNINSVPPEECARLLRGGE
jgi:UDPglucose--hexose-1-phosphate uridylyltransferase